MIESLFVLAAAFSQAEAKEKKDVLPLETTRRIEFDTAGNRAGPAPLAIVERGHLRPVRSADGGAQQQSRLSLSGESVSQ